MAKRSRRSLSPQETLGAAVSQATTFESQFFESQTEEEGAAEGSQAGTAATTEASVDTEPDNGDNFDGINWDRLPRFMKPLTTGRRVKSWIFQHGYRVVELYDQNRVWFVCKYCHIHKVIDTGGSGVFDVSKATSSAAAHLGLQKRGHGFTKDGLKPRRTGQQLSLRQTLETGVAVSQEAANAMGNFNIQQFREVAVFCLLDNNLPMELLARPSFREMISLANPEAEAALWVSPRSVATYAMRLFQYMQPQIVCALSEAASKIHISFDGWTTKGGKRGFFGVVAHFANASGVIQDLPIALPHLAGSHTGDAIADTIKKTLQEYSIGSDKLGYFVLDNAANNDTAVSSLAHAYDFNAAHRRLRCGPHTLNLIGQAIIFGSNQEAYNNNNDEQLQTEEVYMQEWRQEGPLGVLIDVINHIKTPQQHEIFRSFQTAANAELPARERLHVLEPVKPVVTRWNSYYAAFKRATQLQAAYNSYAEHYINALSLEDRRACQRGNKLPEAPSWMRSTGLTAADWAVITEYQDCLEPLKLATEKLEGRGKAGKYGAIYETIPVFEYVLGALEARTRSYEQVDFNPPDAPEDHLFVNLRAAWSKANDYYNKLDRSPAYYAATCLHPYYKYYCENSWVDKPEWLTSANAGFLQLWQSYKPQRTRPLSQTTAKPRHRGIDDVIGALVRRNKAQVEAAHDDEYERWRTQEPEWTSEQYLSDGHPVKYWIQLRSKYPCLSQFAIDILTIPASSCDCERLFSELGDLLEPRRRALGSELLAALQLVRSWRRAGFDGLYNNGDDEDKWSDVKDEEIVQQASKLSDLSTEDRDSYRWEVEQWRLDEITLQKQERALVQLNTEITRSIATRHLYLIQDLPTVYDRLVALKKQFCPSTADRSRDLIARYTNLKTAPRNLKKLDEWMADWIHITSQCQSINLPETTSYRPQEDFLIACQAHYPNYATTCLDQIYEHEINGTNLLSLPAYVEKMTKYIRRAAQTTATESSVLSTSAAKLGIANLPCVCGLSHALPDCWILNPLHPGRPKDWTPAPIGVRKVEQAQKDPKISKQIKDALNEWASRQQYRDKIQVDDGQPPSGGTSFVVHLLDTGQLSPTH
ncbi:Dimer-Tnp-hAT domain containing protein [Pyrenophora tritici-repentis]|nr:Dimer-Tnp-hAT domain containing protein [Pyrenophora tritici-repentis]